MRLIVIAGPEKSGKMPLARRLLELGVDLHLVHRDEVRRILAHPIPEPALTMLMVDMARSLLRHDQSVLAVAQNLNPHDRDRWQGVADEYGLQMLWLDVREPSVAEMIPPLEGWTPEALR